MKNEEFVMEWLEVERAIDLTSYAVSTRYPGVYKHLYAISLKEV